MSREKITERKMAEYFGDSINDYISDLLVDTATRFGVLESSVDVKAIAGFISHEVGVSLDLTMSGIKDDYWD